MQCAGLHHYSGETRLNIHESVPFFLLLASVGVILFVIHKSGLRRGLSPGENRFFRILWVIYGVLMLLFVISELIISLRVNDFQVHSGMITSVCWIPLPSMM